ncbi:PREDICTED: fibrous sheath-interacting protein 2-like [Myotis brandtii]|uniref:fibrous sheath-interacting protein 2-like n=1 Tax=Myotis brandtii TaxID=109478 RepID=UPI000703F2E6|nr:PREDICTED: fibrous sheath-interacting protein 2-like [Myotis brandtii]
MKYLDMISRKLDHHERTAEEQRPLWMEREEKRQWEQTRRKLNLLRKFEEEWKTKEMLLLKETVEDVNREAGIEEQLHRSKESQAGRVNFHL